VRAGLGAGRNCWAANSLASVSAKFERNKTAGDPPIPQQTRAKAFRGHRRKNDRWQWQSALQQQASFSFGVKTEVKPYRSIESPGLGKPSPTLQHHLGIGINEF